MDETTGDAVVPGCSPGSVGPGRAGGEDPDPGGTVTRFSLSGVRGAEAAGVLLPRFDTERDPVGTIRLPVTAAGRARRTAGRARG
ncbi:hypothetical protein [Streptomyces phytophilus]|uniref:hypothetical protein n=1 Tax=Streptomyces phytophilus TaxID=722715 RepID=UPI00215D64F7|nr:hypothetical protein [Streptomyces phytophilus]